MSSLFLWCFAPVSSQTIYFRRCMNYLIILFSVVNPDKEAGRVTLITRYGASKVRPPLSSPLYTFYVSRITYITPFFGSLIHICLPSPSPQLFSPGTPHTFLLFSVLPSAILPPRLYFLLDHHAFFGCMEMAILKPFSPLASCAHSRLLFLFRLLFASVHLFVLFLSPHSSCHFYPLLFVCSSHFLLCFFLVRSFAFFFRPRVLRVPRWNRGVSLMYLAYAYATGLVVGVVWCGVGPKGSRVRLGSGGEGVRVRGGSSSLPPFSFSLILSIWFLLFCGV